MATTIEPLVQTQYPSGTSGIPLQNHIVRTNIQIGAFTDDLPLNLSIKDTIKIEPNHIETNPDLKKYRQICCNWKNYEKAFRQTYRQLFDRNLLWSQYWNKLDRKEQEIYTTYCRLGISAKSFNSRQ